MTTNAGIDLLDDAPYDGTPTLYYVSAPSGMEARALAWGVQIGAVRNAQAARVGRTYGDLSRQLDENKLGTDLVFLVTVGHKRARKGNLVPVSDCTLIS